MRLFSFHYYFYPKLVAAHIITSGHINSFRVHLDIHLEIPRIILIFLRGWMDDLEITEYDTDIYYYYSQINLYLIQIK
jgi:hypothetical protein